MMSEHRHYNIPFQTMDKQKLLNQSEKLLLFYYYFNIILTKSFYPLYPYQVSFFYTPGLLYSKMDGFIFFIVVLHQHRYSLLSPFLSFVWNGFRIDHFYWVNNLENCPLGKANSLSPSSDWLSVFLCLLL